MLSNLFLLLFVKRSIKIVHQKHIKIPCYLLVVTKQKVEKFKWGESFCKVSYSRTQPFWMNIKQKKCKCCSRLPAALFFILCHLQKFPGYIKFSPNCGFRSWQEMKYFLSFPSLSLDIPHIFDSAFLLLCFPACCLRSEMFFYFLFPG